MDVVALFKILKLIFTALPWVLSIGALHQFLYNKFPKYYFFFVKRFKKWRDTKWKLTVSFSVHKDIDFFSSLEEVINEIYKQKQRVFNLKNKKQYEFADYTLTVQYDLDFSEGEFVNVELLFGNITATKSTAVEKLRNLRRFFNTLNSRIDLRDENYSMRIYFITMKNPFYGLMIQRLGSEHIEYFQCVFSINQLTQKAFNKRVEQQEVDQELTVYKDYIAINHHNYDTIEDVTRKCLLLEG
ncbi:hypothetical protein SRCM101294_02960 [Bacillus amyloliquefaciens]|uniref:hypothetical protein n=1 Tax=Bacillus amyloliquefaciens group TaxID=1938374 RepID=UPI00080C8371|nr:MULTISPECIES: hypothetical protein [Bacillus amyloliquefaciens group]MDN4142510.1 hypothetical protein [Bacillus velezensis]OCB93596.1 hypothetical protein SRCM101294_02960 [Bacillus amyloliquefaciens]